MTAPVIWAQRNTVVYVTICLEDCKNPDIKIEPEQVYFRGVGGPEKKVYEVTIPLYAKVEPEVRIICLLINFLTLIIVILQNSKTSVGGRYIELVLQKPSEDTKYWPHLTKEKKKYHWLKVDFKKWKDEDETDDETVGGGDGNIDDVS